jgi:uncharacterized protein with HEPN domain
MTGLRDVLIHQYFQVDYQVVWDVIQNMIPLAKDWIDQIIEQEESNL